MSAIDWAMVLEYLKVVFTWPLVVLVLGLVLTARFKEPIDFGIREIARRFTSGKFAGAEVNAAPPSQDQPNKPEKSELEKATEGDQVPENLPAAADEGVPEQLPPELQNDPSAAAAIAYVKANPAETVVEYKKAVYQWKAERLFAHAYGTQIALLEFLSGAPEIPAPQSVLRQFYDEHIRRGGRPEYDFSEYLQFLANLEAIDLSYVDNTKHATITTFGVEFLKYIKANYPGHWNQRQF